MEPQSDVIAQPGDRELLSDAIAQASDRKPQSHVTVQLGIWNRSLMALPNPGI